MRGKFDVLFDALSDMLEAEADPDDMGVLASTLYDQAVKKYRPVIGLFPRLVQKVAADIRPIVVGFLGTSIQFRKDEEIQNLMTENAMLRAVNRKQRMDQFIEAGFAREEAMALLLQDVANGNAAIQRLSTASRSSSISSSSSSRQRR